MRKFTGLSSSKAQSLLGKYGENILPREKKKVHLQLLLEQIKSPLIYVLLFAAGVTLILGDYTDTAVILFAVFINTILGFYQELKAEEALAALQKILKPHAKVVRDGKVKNIEAKLLVPGDLVILGTGDLVPADGILVEAVNLSVNEAILTGESMPVRKKVDEKAFKVFESKNFVASNSFSVFMGTTVVSGRGKFVVSTTGEKTEMGKIAQKLITVKQEKTPLQKRLSKVAKTLALMVAAISLGILIIGLVSGNSFVTMFTTSVAIAVAAIPEGMAVSLTVILAIGMQRILKRKALVRKLLAAETLGSVSVIATDKTGTLTEGVMRVSKTDLVDKEEALLASIFANNLEDSLEVALWNWAKSQGKDPQKLTEENPRQSETPFDSEKKYMSVTVNNTLYIKGAPEVVLGRCQMPEVGRRRWLKKVDSWASSGLRLLGLASGKKWLGLVGIEDPVRNDLAEVFAQTTEAGIKTIMVTGDYTGTARAVWEKITGFNPVKMALGSSKQKIRPLTIDGAQLEKLGLGELRKIVREADIFARVSPNQKLKIVEALKENGEVVALVGDGVNDAPAIKLADIGIVVGEASDVARETADMVLLDSNFKTIVAAIEEGRGIFENIKKVILYLLSDSFSEVILISFSILLGIPLPLTAAQILWINLLTDGFPNLALTVEPKEAGLLKRKPLEREMPLIDLEMKTLIAIISGVTGIVSLVVFWYFWRNFDLRLARTVAFAALGVDSLLYVFSVRSLHKPIWKINHLKNPFLLVAVIAGFLLQLVSLYHPFFNKFLQTVPLSPFEWGVVLGASALVIVLIETVKFVFKLDKSVKNMSL